MILSPESPEITLPVGEWITVASTICLLIGSFKDFAYGNNTILHFWPITNPDGYDYTWHGLEARHWRKNRNYEGVDLNRNFGIENITWGFGSRTNKQSELFQGEH